MDWRGFAPCDKTGKGRFVPRGGFYFRTNIRDGNNHKVKRR